MTNKWDRIVISTGSCTATGIKLTRWPSCHWGKCYDVLSVIDLTSVERIIACTTHVKLEISRQLFSVDKNMLKMIKHNYFFPLIFYQIYQIKHYN